MSAPREKQVTFSPHGHIVTNVGVWSPDGQWIVYDVRSDPEGSRFDGTRIEQVHVETGEVRVLYKSQNGACCGVVTFSPSDNRVVFIHGPENPTSDWQYSIYHRRGVLVEASHPNVSINLDARDLTPPFTPGALRGGTHLHTLSGDGSWISFTYDDHVLAQLDAENSDHDINQRNVGVSVPVKRLCVPKDHPRNHDGQYFSVIVTRTVSHPEPGSDQISRAFSDAWVGTRGYIRPDGTRQQRAIAFQGHVVTDSGQTISEAFLVDLPEEMTTPSLEGSLEGTATRRPLPPQGTRQRRLTYTTNRRYPGLQGPRHWLRSSPDGSQIAFLMRDDSGVVQIWTISPNGGQPVQITHNQWDVASTFTWDPTGRQIVYAMDNSIFLTDVSTGKSTRLTPRSPDAEAPRPEACVFSPDGGRITYVRRIADQKGIFNQIFVLSLQ